MAKRKAKQPRLPGMEPESIKELDDAAEIYFDAMQARVKLSKEEDEAKDNLIDKMKEHGTDIYETPDGLVVTITNKSNVKCKKKSDESEEPDDAES